MGAAAAHGESAACPLCTLRILPAARGAHMACRFMHDNTFSCQLRQSPNVSAEQKSHVRPSMQMIDAACGLLYLQ